MGAILSNGRVEDEEVEVEVEGAAEEDDMVIAACRLLACLGRWVGWLLLIVGLW